MRNYPYVFWLLFYFYLMWGICGFMPKAFNVLAIIYGCALVLALTPVAESIMRALQGFRRSMTEREASRINDIFTETYESAKEVNPALFKSIKIYIQDTMDINAFAMGKKTLGVTRGALEFFNDEELHGILAHEMGHFSNGDTVALLVSLTANILFMVAYKILYAIASLFHSIIASKYDSNIMKIVWWCVDKLCKFIMFIGDVILMPVSRRNEYYADEFAHECGYGEALTTALYKLQMLAGEEPRKISDYVKKTHPAIVERIARLEQLERADEESPVLSSPEA